MAKQINVNVQERKPGKKHVKMTRSHNLVPVVIYGNGKPSQFGAIEALSFKRDVLAHEHALFSLSFNGKSVSAVVRNLDIDYLNHKVVHADFYEVNMNVEMDATVSIIFVGEPAGISEGGVMNKVLEELHIFCLPSNIPGDIEVDVSHLSIDDRILVSDLKLPSNIEVLHDPDQTVVAIAIKAEEPEEEVAAPLLADAVAATPAVANEAADHHEKGKEKKEEKAS
jgi:large subunit ribosomal protein L25